MAEITERERQRRLAPVCEKSLILDHGYLQQIECWGSDESIIEAARMSTGKGFLGWGGDPCSECEAAGRLDPKDWGWVSYKASLDADGCKCNATGKAVGDEKLLRYLHENQHATPFEMAGMVIEVQAPIMVFREWHRHRTQCLGPDTLVHFEMPKAVKRGGHTVYKQRIEDLWRKWQPTSRSDRQERQVNSLWPRSRIRDMHLRTLDEDGGEFTTSHITDVILGQPKEMVRLTVESGRSLTATLAHKVITDRGWMMIEDALKQGAGLAMEGTARSKVICWEPLIPSGPEAWRDVLGWRGIYEVSDHGRVKRIAPGRGTQAGSIKTLTRGAQGYLVVGLTHQGSSAVRTVHSLVLESFVGPPAPGQEGRHKNHNRMDCRLENLEWGSSEDNSNDMTSADRCQRLVPVYEEIKEVEFVGMMPTYDLSVSDPWHNFVADGFVVHNSYNEMSARYTPLPDLNYVPTVDRLLLNSKTNKQAGVVAGAGELDEAGARRFREDLRSMYGRQEALYQASLQCGVPKELARVHLPVGRYSRMRASANLRNWLAFLTLRMDPKAQWEIRQFANAVGELIRVNHPKTWELFSFSLAKWK